MLDSRIADGYVLWDTVVPEGNGYLEQLKVLNIVTGGTKVVDSAPPTEPGWARTFVPGGLNGDAIAYLRVANDGSRMVVLRSITAGAEHVVPSPTGEVWEAISPDARFAVARLALAPAQGSTPAGPRFAVDLATGRSVRFAEGQSYGWVVTFAGTNVAWQVTGDDHSVIGYFSFDTGVSRVLDPSIADDGQLLGVLDGWFFWRERAPGYTSQDNDRKKDLLRLVPLL